MEIGGEEEDQVKGFKDLGVVLGISVSMIFLALVFQFKNAIKPGSEIGEIGENRINNREYRHRDCHRHSCSGRRNVTTPKVYDSNTKLESFGLI